MIFKEFSWYATLVSILIIICNVETKFKDRFPFCTFASNGNCSMKPQTKVLVEWDRLYGTWWEVFRYEHGSDNDEAIYNRDIYKKNDKGYIDGTYAYRSSKGTDHEFPIFRIKQTGDVSNSWYKVSFDSIPEYLAKWQKIVVKQLIKRELGLNYVILNIDEDYNWLLKCEPCRRTAVLLQKGGTPKLSQSVIDENIDCMKRNGYKYKPEELVFLPYPDDRPEWKN